MLQLIAFDELVECAACRHYEMLEALRDQVRSLEAWFLHECEIASFDSGSMKVRQVPTSGAKRPSIYRQCYPMPTEVLQSYAAMVHSQISQKGFRLRHIIFQSCSVPFLKQNERQQAGADTQVAQGFYNNI